MSEKIKCKVIISPKVQEHCSQIVTGFILLKQQNLIDLQIELSDRSLISMVEVIMNDKVRVAYDMADGYNFHLDRVKNFFENIDIIFKRSYKYECHQSTAYSAMVKPLGLNYHVTTKGNIIDKAKK